MDKDYHVEIYNSDDFYEKQARLLNGQSLLQSAIEEIDDIQEFNDLKDYIKIALDEARRLEREY